MSFSLLGKAWDVAGFAGYLRGLDLSWAHGVCLHHTAAPSLSQRPEGLRIQHVRNIAHYYRTQKGWDRGPHLFVDSDQIFGMSPLTERGIHARAFNATHLGIEVLGSYDQKDDPKSGRGLLCWRMAAAAVALIRPRLRQSVNWLKFHREDAATSKSCPGRRVEKSWFAGLVDEFERDQDREDGAAPRKPGLDELREIAAALRWQVDKLERQLAN